ncbi:MAG: DUF502 domain-containing protein [Bacillota bacterium]
MLKHLRNYFLTGIFVLIPVVVTVKIVIWGFNQTDAILGNLIYGIFKIRILGLGLFTLLALTIFVGILAHNFIGRKLIEFGDRLLGKIPILNSIYGTTKQITENFTKTDKSIFRKVVMVEYPRQGILSPGFLTGAAPSEVSLKTGQNLLSVFIPTVPNPTTGFLIFMPEEKVTPLDMTIEEGFKLIISAGVIKPN